MPPIDVLRLHTLVCVAGDAPTVLKVTYGDISDQTP